MLELSPATIVLVAAVAAFTAVAAFWDFRTRRIPNVLTIPMFLAGWVYQFVVSLKFGWEHLASAGLGFAVGFGLLFVLWIIGGGGGGDVKLVGALSVWLGLQMTLWVLFVSTLLVVIATVFVMAWNVARQGLRQTKHRYLATGKAPAGQAPRPETRDEKLGRRVMAYAGPVAVATWLVVLWSVPRLERSLLAAPPAQRPATGLPVEAPQ